MTALVAGILGIVVGYGLAQIRELLRVRDCETDCVAMRILLRQRIEQDKLIGSLFAETETLARRIVLQERLAETRQGVTKS